MACRWTELARSRPGQRHEVQASPSCTISTGRTSATMTAHNMLVFHSARPSAAARGERCQRASRPCDEKRSCVVVVVVPWPPSPRRAWPPSRRRVVAAGSSSSRGRNCRSAATAAVRSGRDVDVNRHIATGTRAWRSTTSLEPTTTASSSTSSSRRATPELSTARASPRSSSYTETSRFHSDGIYYVASLPCSPRLCRCRRQTRMQSPGSSWFEDYSAAVARGLTRRWEAPASATVARPAAAVPLGAAQGGPHDGWPPPRRQEAVNALVQYNEVPRR